MPDTSSVVVLPTNSATLYLDKTAGQSVDYGNLVGLTYASLATHTYGGLQNLGDTNTEVVVIPTGATTIYLQKERTLADYTSIFASWGTTYAAITGLSYGQLSVVP